MGGGPQRRDSSVEDRRPSFPKGGSGYPAINRINYLVSQKHFGFGWNSEISVPPLPKYVLPVSVNGIILGDPPKSAYAE